MNQTDTHDQIAFRWRDTDSLLVHEVSAAVVDGSPADGPSPVLIDDATTLCGIQIFGAFDPSDDEVTCAFCIEGDWLRGLGRILEAPEAVSGRKPLALPA